MPTSADTLASNVNNAIVSLSAVVSAANTTLSGYVSGYTSGNIPMLNDVVALGGGVGSTYYDKAAAVTVPTTTPSTLAAVSVETVAAQLEFYLSPLPDFPSTAGSTLQAITMPTMPTIDPYAALSGLVWPEQFWTDLKAGLTNLSALTTNANVAGVVSGFISNTGALQGAIYGDELQRKQQALRDVQSAANSRTGNRGFTFPNSMTTALLLDAQQKYQFDLSQVARDLTKYLFEWAKSSHEFTIQQSINAHQADVEFNTRYSDTLIRVYTTKVQAALDTQKVAVDMALAQADQEVRKYNALVEALLRKYAAFVQAYGAENGAMLQVEDTKLKITTGILESQKIKASILETGDRLAIAKYAERVRDYLGATGLEIESAAKEALNKITAAEAMVKNASALASTSSQIAIGILPAV